MYVSRAGRVCGGLAGISLVVPSCELEICYDMGRVDTSWIQLVEGICYLMPGIAYCNDMGLSGGL